jgi:hypothetical protein
MKHNVGMSETLRILVFSVTLAALLPLRTVAAAEQTICAGNRPAEGTVITATGTSAFCDGSCRARATEPADAPMMIICTGQPIPDKYEIESITTTPRCACLSEHDNAYVIRRLSNS